MFTKKIKKFKFIKTYLALLALPMVCGFAGLLVVANQAHRNMTLDKIRIVNHSLALMNTDFFQQLERLVSITVLGDNRIRLSSAEKSVNYYRSQWDDQAHLNPLSDSVFYADSQGGWFTNDKDRDKEAQAKIDEGMKLTNRVWYQGALERPGKFYWSTIYTDIANQRPSLTGAYLLPNKHGDGNKDRVVAVDVNLAVWSQRIANTLTADNGLRHLLIDKQTSMICMHSNPGKIGEHFNGEWKNKLVGQSGIFFDSTTQEFVAYEVLIDKPELVAVTVQPWRQSFVDLNLALLILVPLLTVSLFYVIAKLFQLKLVLIMEYLVNQLRKLRHSPGDRKLDTGVGIEEFKELESELSQTLSHISDTHQKSVRDALTGLYNRRYFNDLISRLQTNNTPFVMALIDLDNFKNINDSYGHGVGDVVLNRIATLGLTVLGEKSTLCRYGGEELVAIFEHSSLEDAQALMESWRTETADLKWREPGLNVTFSTGIANLTYGQSTTDLLAVVDEALYLAKRTGKNRICRGYSHVAVS